MITSEGEALRSRVSGVAGWALVVGAAVTPALAWIAPLGFAPLLALMGLASLPTLRLRDEDRPALIVLFALLIWAAVSTTWSPYQPKNAGSSTILKLAFELPLYVSALYGARAAPAGLQQRAMQLFAWGTAAFSLVMLVEAASGGILYRTLHVAFYEPIRPDLAQANLGHGSYVFAVLWPLATLAAPAKLRPWFALVIGAGVLAAGLAFGSDAPVLSILLTPLVAGAVWWKPGCGPKVFAGMVAGFFLLAPAVLWGLRFAGVYDDIQRAVPLSWSERMGYWHHAILWIDDRPLRGWGLDASRMFAPGIILHPHDGALQVWLELGAVGAIGAAAFWGVTLLRLSRPEKSLAMTAAAGAGAAYMLFGALNFGIWQEWWLAVGALACVATAVLFAEEQRTPTAST